MAAYVLCAVALAVFLLLFIAAEARRRYPVGRPTKQRRQDASEEATDA